MLSLHLKLELVSSSSPDTTGPLWSHDIKLYLHTARSPRSAVHTLVPCSCGGWMLLLWVASDKSVCGVNVMLSQWRDADWGAHSARRVNTVSCFCRGSCMKCASSRCCCVCVFSLSRANTQVYIHANRKINEFISLLVFKFRKALIKTLFSLGKYICKANNTVTVLQPRDIVSYHI